MADKPDRTGLSFKEMKFKVCRFMEEQGIVNDVRARLRYKFVEALKISSQSSNKTSKTLLHQVVHWLIQEYLSSQNYNYTLCTLACESGIGQESFSVRDVETLLHVSRGEHSKSTPVLQHMVDQMMRPQVATSAQTSLTTDRTPPGSALGTGEDGTAAQLQQLKKVAEDAKQLLDSLHQQLNQAQHGNRADQPRNRQQTVHHLSMLTAVSSLDADTSQQGPSTLTTSRQVHDLQQSNDKSTSVSSARSPPLERARRRLEHLAVQTDFLDQRFQQLKCEPLEAIWVSVSRETTRAFAHSPTRGDVG
ncbi:unnamed protein product [Ixodes hexagonus]